METHLFGSIIFGPVRSRRLGLSLGINLLPAEKKVCTFECVYCECGWTEKKHESKLPKVNQVVDALEKQLKAMIAEGEIPDVLTFAGNGEPTLHPEFNFIMKETVRLRNELAPSAKIAVLSNSTQLYKPLVAEALKMADKAILKLDSTDPGQFRLINNPAAGIELEQIMRSLKDFDGNFIVQTLLLRGEFGGKRIDNINETSLNDLAAFVSSIGASEWMIYPIDRPTPDKNLEKIGKEEMDYAGSFLRKRTNVPVTVRY
ncbi:MAG: radical SAM protein [Bacteroidetes bacterium HGW-Bacteroidetes-6]|jgi:wyosine [tRNA(Phe)-imidazoG37] synthetase (radical SAM superfamily)|nr:MAG: radical SAM protein [Bacteroidetes bacterium HGW-Bacteroidetes-6]